MFTGGGPEFLGFTNRPTRCLPAPPGGTALTFHAFGVLDDVPIH